MPIVDIQRRVHEIGRIRIGEYVGDHPRALQTFRFTSPRKDLMEQAAVLFGGEVTPWNNQWQVITTTDELDVLVPPEDVAFSQWWEAWTGGGCTRRCDGRWNVIADEPCSCVASGERTCEPITRLSVILPAFQVFGVFRLETGSWYAAGELQSAVGLALQLSEMAGGLASAVLRVERRVVKRPGLPPNRFSVPVLDVALPPALGDRPDAGSRQIANGRQTLGPASLDVAGLPEPQPKLARGEPSPPPAPDLTAHDEDAPPTLPSPQAEPALVYAPAETPPPAVDESRAKFQRGVFAQVRDVLKDLADVDADTLRYTLAIMETAKRRDEPCTSWNDLTDAELSGVAARLVDIKRGGLKVKPIAKGLAFTTASGRTLEIFRDDTDEWQYQLTPQA